MDVAFYLAVYHQFGRIVAFLAMPCYMAAKDGVPHRVGTAFGVYTERLNAGSLHRRDTLREEAIITQGVVNAKSSPDRSGTDLFTLHEGTKVDIRESLGEWCNIRVGNNQGWIRLSTLERI